MPLIDSIKMISTTPPTQDIKHPANLEVTRAEFGNMVQAMPDATTTTRIDPLLLELKNVEPGATLEILVVNDPKKTWDNSKGDVKAIKVALTDLGDKQQLALSDAKAKELGINPGDAIEIRQVDAAGNASKPTRVFLNGDGGTIQNFRPVGGAQLGDVMLSNPTYTYVYNRTYGYTNTSDVYNFVRARDTSKPVVHPEDFSLTLRDPQTGDSLLSGKMAVERMATVLVKNLATRESFTVRSDEDGTFELPVKASSGDPLQILVFDRGGVTEDLGTIVFQPTVDPASTQQGNNGQQGTNGQQG